jgi:hypothetical protein
MGKGQTHIFRRSASDTNGHQRKRTVSNGNQRKATEANGRLRKGKRMSDCSPTLDIGLWTLDFISTPIRTYPDLSGKWKFPEVPLWTFNLNDTRPRNPDLGTRNSLVPRSGSGLGPGSNQERQPPTCCVLRLSPIQFWEPFLHHFLHFAFAIALQIQGFRSGIAPCMCLARAERGVYAASLPENSSRGELQAPANSPIEAA